MVAQKLMGFRHTALLPQVEHPIRPARSHCPRNRRLELLQRSGLFGHNTLGTEIERVWQLSEFREAYKLVHDSFVEAGYITAHPSGMRIRPFEAIPEMATFIAFSEAEARTVAVLSVLADSHDLGLPADGVFRSELSGLRSAGARLCEVTNQAVVSTARKSAVSTELMRCGMAHALTKGFNEAIAVVSPTHAAVYKLMGFRQIGTVRSYSHTIHDPVVALSMHIDQFRLPPLNEDPADAFVRDFMVHSNPYYAKVKSWEQHARGFFSHPRLLRRLFVLEEKLLQRCSPDELAAIRKRWGSLVYAEVMGKHRPPNDGSAILAQFDSERLTCGECLFCERCACDRVCRCLPK